MPVGDINECLVCPFLMEPNKAFSSAEKSEVKWNFCFYQKHKNDLFCSTSLVFLSNFLEIKR